MVYNYQTNPSVVLPRDCRTIEDIPIDLHLAIEQAQRILKWVTELPEDECPPAWMWTLDWELDEWFAEVKIIREQKYGGGSTSNSGHSYDDTWEENDYAKELRGR